MKTLFKNSIEISKDYIAMVMLIIAAVVTVVGFVTATYYFFNSEGVLGLAVGFIACQILLTLRGKKKQ